MIPAYLTHRPAKSKRQCGYYFQTPDGTVKNLKNTLLNQRKCMLNLRKLKMCRLFWNFGNWDAVRFFVCLDGFWSFWNFHWKYFCEILKYFLKGLESMKDKNLWLSFFIGTTKQNNLAYWIAVTSKSVGQTLINFKGTKTKWLRLRLL